jgi:hypothetical protein
MEGRTADAARPISTVEVVLAVTAVAALRLGGLKHLVGLAVGHFVRPGVRHLVGFAVLVRSIVRAAAASVGGHGRFLVLTTFIDVLVDLLIDVLVDVLVCVCFATCLRSFADGAAVVAAEAADYVAVCHC